MAMADDGIQVGTLRRNADGSFRGELRRLYEGHDRAEVWRMLTESGRMAQWLAAGDIELRQGGAVRIDFADSGILIESTVLEVDPQRVLAYSWSSGSEPQRPLRWALADATGSTQLTLTVGIPAGEDAVKACAGFEGHLEMLAGALEGVPMKFPFELFLKARTAYGKQVAQ